MGLMSENQGIRVVKSRRTLRGLAGTAVLITGSGSCSAPIDVRITDLTVHTF